MEQVTKKKKRGKMVIIVLVIALVIGTLVVYWLSNQNFITSDNAQVDCNIVAVRSSVSAYLKSVCFTDNQTVEKGQVLFILDSADLALRVEQSKAALRIAEAKLESAKERVSASTENATAGDLTAESYQQTIISAKANLDKAQSAFDRVNNLLKIKAVTQEQFETAEANLTVAKADYAKAVNVQKSSTSSSQSLRSIAKSDETQVSLAEAQVEQSKADLQLAKHQLEYAVVKAPCSGIVSKRAVQEGQYISAGQNFCAIVDNENLWVTANFKETQLKSIKPGQAVKIKVDAYPDLNLDGKIESFSGATGAKYSLLPPDNSTGNFIKITQRVPVKISFAELPKDKIHQLLPGMSVFVKTYSK